MVFFIIHVLHRPPGSTSSTTQVNPASPTGKVPLSSYIIIFFLMVQFTYLSKSQFEFVE